MNENPTASAMPDDIAMHRRRITLQDGRYMLFYTFGDRESAPDADSPPAKEEPRPTPQAEEERHV